MKKIILNFILILIITTGIALAAVAKSEVPKIKINYIHEEENALVTLEEEPVDLEIGNGRVWISNIDNIKSKNSSFVEPKNKVFIGWKYRDSIISGITVASTSAYETGNHFTQNEYYSLSANETEINLVAVWGYTVYVDAVNGIDDAKGTSESTPVRTVGRAYEILAKLDSGNSNANITGFSVTGDSSTGYVYGAEDTANLITNFNGRIVIKNNIAYKDQYEGRYLYITYGDLINSENYDSSTGKTTFNDGVSTKTFTDIKAASGYSENDPVKLSGSKTTYKVGSKTASGSYHHLLKKVVNSYSYEVNGTTYYTYGRLTQYTENLRAHTGKGLMSPINDGLVLITSNDGTNNYGATWEFADYTRYASGGDLIYRDINISFFHNTSLDKESETYVCGYAANGNYLAMDENITMIKDSTHVYASIYGGGHAYRAQSINYSGTNGNKLGNSGPTALNNARLTIKSGTYYGAYNANYGQKMGRDIATYGTTENNSGVINVYGGTFSLGVGMGHEGATAVNSYVYVYGGQAATVHGSGLGSSGAMIGNGTTNVLITGESTKVTGTVYGGSSTGKHTGDINIVIKNGTIGNTIYGGNSKEDVTGNINITITGGTMKTIVGGCTTGSINGTTTVNISGGTIVGNIYTSGQGGTQEVNDTHYQGNSSSTGLSAQILDINDDRLNVLITGDSSVDSEAIVSRAKKVNSSATQHHNDKVLTVSGVDYYYPQLYASDYMSLIAGYIRGTYDKHSVKQYTISSRVSSLSLATVNGVNLNITGGDITGNIFGGGRVAVVQGDVNMNISNAKITGNVFGGGDGSVEPTVNFYIPTGRNTTKTVAFTWKGSETFNVDEYDTVKNPPIDWDNKYVYSPAYDYMGGVAGNVNINIDNGSIITGNVYGGGNKGFVFGEVTLNVDNASVNNSIYGGGNIGHVFYSTQLTLKDVITPNLYGGGYSGKVEGSSTITLTNSNITEVFGGGYAGDVNGNTNITITSGNYTNVFAGCDKAVVSGDTHIDIGNEEELAIVISGLVYGGGRGVDADGDGDASDFCTVNGKSEVIIKGLNTQVENYGSIKLGDVLGDVDVTFKDYWTGNTTNKYKVMNGIDRATNVYFDNAFVLLENKDENGNLVGIKDITNLHIPEESGIKISATGEILGDFYGGGTFYLDSEVCLNIRGNIYGKSLVVLNPVIIEEGNIIKGSKEYPYMRIYGEDNSNGTALYSDDEKYEIIHSTEDGTGASIYFIASDVLITETIVTNIINADGKHYTDDSSQWPSEDFYVINSGTFSTDCEIKIAFLDDGELGDLYKDISRSLVMYTGDILTTLPTGTNIVMIINDEYYSYRTTENTSEISLESFEKMDDETAKYKEVSNIRRNATLVGGNELKKSYEYNETFRFIVDFSEAKEEELLKMGPYNLILKFHDAGAVSESKADSVNTIRIEEPRKYNLEYSFDREWYESDSVIDVDLTMTSEYYILFDQSHTSKELTALISVKDKNGEYVTFTDAIQFYIDNTEINHTNGNAQYDVLSGLTQTRMEVKNNLKIDMTKVIPVELLSPGENTICIDYYISKDGVLEEQVEAYELKIQIVKFNDYSLYSVVKSENGKAGKELLNVNRNEDNSRIIQINYIGDLIDPYVGVVLQNKVGDTFETMTNSVTQETYTISENIQEIDAIFGSALSSGTYRMNFELYDKYNDLKSVESLIFTCQ